MTINSVAEGYYCTFKLPTNIFNKLNKQYFITHCTEDTKYMCANEQEIKHLESLGINSGDCCCDWFKLIRSDYVSPSR